MKDKQLVYFKENEFRTQGNTTFFVISETSTDQHSVRRKNVQEFSPQNFSHFGRFRR